MSLNVHKHPNTQPVIDEGFHFLPCHLYQMSKWEDPNEIVFAVNREVSDKMLNN